MTFQEAREEAVNTVQKNYEDVWNGKKKVEELDYINDIGTMLAAYKTLMAEKEALEDVKRT